MVSFLFSVPVEILSMVINNKFWQQLGSNHAPGTVKKVLLNKWFSTVSVGGGIIQIIIQSEFRLEKASTYYIHTYIPLSK